MNWQLIKTAPKDGTKVLVFDGVDIYVASWEDTSNGPLPHTHFEWVFASVITDYNDYLVVFYPTHWMPLPPLPIMEGE